MDKWEKAQIERLERRVDKTALARGLANLGRDG